MSKYRVMIHGQNFLIEVEGTRERMGFYTQVFVEAGDASTAEAHAVNMLRQECKLREGVLNGPDDRPRMSVAEIEQITSFAGCKLPRTGLAFYVEEEQT
jgi:hypothetical protein